MHVCGPLAWPCVKFVTRNWPRGADRKVPAFPSNCDGKKTFSGNLAREERDKEIKEEENKMGVKGYARR